MFPKKIVCTVFLLMILMAVSTKSYSQNYDSESKNWPGTLAGRSSDMLYKQLNLTDAQYNQMYTSFYTFYSNQSPDLLGYGPYTNWSDQRTSISGYLTPDQVTKFSTFEDNYISNPTMKRQFNNSNDMNEKSDMNKTGNQEINKPITTDPTVPGNSESK